MRELAARSLPRRCPRQGRHAQGRARSAVAEVRGKGEPWSPSASAPAESGLLGNCDATAAACPAVPLRLRPLSVLMSPDRLAGEPQPVGVGLRRGGVDRAGVPEASVDEHGDLGPGDGASARRRTPRSTGWSTRKRRPRRCSSFRSAISGAVSRRRWFWIRRRTVGENALGPGATIENSGRARQATQRAWEKNRPMALRWAAGVAAFASHVSRPGVPSTGTGPRTPSAQTGGAEASSTARWAAC